MREFWTENGRIVTKLILNQFGAAVMGLMITAAAASNQTLKLFTSLFAICFYLMLLYMVVWEKGGQDRIRFDGGRAAWQPLNGLKMSLLHNIPNILFAVLIIIGYIFGKKGGMFEMEWAGNMYAIFNAIGRLWHGMYIGLIQTYSPNNPIAHLLVVLPAMFTCTFGYYMGLTNRRVFSIFELSPPKKQKDETDPKKKS
ncbi:MAG: hypothetical protein E7631_01205 [Ruminococcaceae bacterium]|nr:hypothetical protein [Oscillospiraceae bacterium]